MVRRSLAVRTRRSSCIPKVQATRCGGTPSWGSPLTGRRPRWSTSRHTYISHQSNPVEEYTMAELETTEQALAYLAEMSPTETFHVQPFQSGWVATKVLTPEQMTSGEAVGLAHLVIDSETGIVYQYPSWSEMMVADAHTAFKLTGINRAGRQIYPYQWTITVERTQENDQTITYQMTAESLTDP